MHGPAASFLRRGAALLYDAVVLSALLMASTALALLINHGEPVPRLWLRGVSLAVTYGFYVWFWTHGGQTLGMRAWRLQVVGGDAEPPDLRAASVRFAAAALSWAACGAGFLWILIDKERLAWHDRLSKTRIVVLPPRSVLK